MNKDRFELTNWFFPFVIIAFFIMLIEVLLLTLQQLHVDVLLLTLPPIIFTTVLAWHIWRVNINIQYMARDLGRFSSETDHQVSEISEISNRLSIMMSKVTVELERIGSFQAQLAEPQSRSFQSLQSVQMQLNTIAQDISVLVDRLNSSTQMLENSRRPQASGAELLPDRLITIYQQISSEYSHAVKTPLASVATALKNVKEQLPLVLQGDDGASGDKYRLLLISLDNASLSIEDIRTILRHGAGFLPGNATRFSIQKIVGRAIAMTKEATGIAPNVSLTVGSLPDVKYHESNLLVAILQVIENAFEATGPQGQLRIGGEYDEANEEISILFTNTHTGMTISQGHKEQIFESGFSTKKMGRGVGLALARRSLDLVNGKILVEDSTDLETTFRIVIRPEKIYSSLEVTHG